MSDSQMIIEVQGLYKTFFTDGNKVEVLKDLNLSIKKGDTLAVVGASGVGKTTLLHIIGTLEQPTQGTVLYYGTNIFSCTDQELSRFRNKKIGFVFQFHHLLSEFNALENVMIPMLIAGIKEKAAILDAEQILCKVGLKDRLRHKIGELSGGEQQRVAVARSLVLNPEILLADEPTGNLDRRTGEQIHELLLRLNEEDGITIMVATHNQDLANKMARCVRLMDGKAWPEE